MNRAELEAIVAQKMNGHNSTAVDVIDTIFAAIQYPTDEMAKAWAYAPTPPSSRRDWQAMLTASPLAPEGGET